MSQVDICKDCSIRFIEILQERIAKVKRNTLESTGMIDEFPEVAAQIALLESLIVEVACTQYKNGSEIDN